MKIKATQAETNVLGGIMDIYLKATGLKGMDNAQGVLNSIVIQQETKPEPVEAPEEITQEPEDADED